MNLKQKTFLFVTVSVLALLIVYVAFSTYYVRAQEKVLLDERLGTAQSIAQELTGFFARGDGELPLPKSIRSAILISKRPGSSERRLRQKPTDMRICSR